MDERIDELRERLREDPTSRQFYQLGELLRREGEDAEAVEVLRVGLDQHPFYVTAWVSLGRALLALDRLDEADEVLAEALKLDPENAVAAQLRGQVAIDREDWLGAIKALKLARALAPGDRDLDERIADAEARLAAEATVAVPQPQPLEIFSVSAGDPFEMTPRGDTGVWMAGEADVFTPPELPPEPPPEAVPEEPEEIAAAAEGDGAAAAAEPVPLGEAAAPATPVDEPDEAPDGGSWPREVTGAPLPDLEPAPPESPAGAPGPEPSTAAEPAPPAALEAGELLAAIPEELDLPLPTLTLARLALDQGDLELARRTAAAVLEREPGSIDAQDLLAEVARAVPVPEAGGADPRFATIVALQRWLDAVRLAAGKLAS